MHPAIAAQLYRKRHGHDGGPVERVSGHAECSHYDCISLKAAREALSGGVHLTAGGEDGSWSRRQSGRRLQHESLECYTHQLVYASYHNPIKMGNLTGKVKSFAR